MEVFLLVKVTSDKTCNRLVYVSDTQPGPLRSHWDQLRSLLIILIIWDRKSLTDLHWGALWGRRPSVRRSLQQAVATRKPEITRNILEILEKEVFEKQINKVYTDERLKTMVSWGTPVAFNYSSLVLFPEVFTSWVRSRREDITAEEANEVYQSVGKNTSESS